MKNHAQGLGNCQKKGGRKMGTLFFMLFALGILTCLNLFAQGTNGTATTDVSGTLNLVQPVVSGIVAALTAKYGWVVAVLTWIGVLRTCMKPITQALDAIAAQNPGSGFAKDVAVAEASTAYKWVCFALDYVASIKVGTQVKR